MVASNQSNMQATRVNLIVWFWRVITWDGVMPLVLFGVPQVLLWAFPGINFDNGKLAIIGLPMAALFVRLLIVCYYISANHCVEWWRSCQQLSLVFGIFLLSFSDVYMSYFILIPQEENREPDFYFLQLSLVIFGMALPFLVFAMYPGREPVPQTEIGNWVIECQSPK